LRALSENGWDLRVCRQMRDNVAQVLELTGFMALLPFEERA
jgi:hypothetical protein